MRVERAFVRLAVVLICCLVLASGCVEQTAPVMPAPARFDTVTYKLMTSSQRSLKFKGSLADDAGLKGGRTGNRVTMNFTRQIQRVDDKGSTVVKITIEKLSYYSYIKDSPTIQFDSSIAADAESPLAGLIGRSYTIEIDPNGRVTRLVDAAQALAAVEGTSPAHQAAARLLEPDVIKYLHSIPLLPAVRMDRLKVGESWSSAKSFSYGVLGTRFYERTYTVKEISDAEGRRIAVVKMRGTAVPETAQQGQLSDVPIQAETYTGMMELDLAGGRVNSYVERLETQWIVVDPQSEIQDVNKPDSFTMGITRLYSLTRTD